MARKANNQGQALLVAVMFLAALSVSAAAGLSAPFLSQLQAVKELTLSRPAYLVAESGVEDAVYRLRNSLNVSSNYELGLGAETASVSVTQNGNQWTVESSGNSEDRIRSIEGNLQLSENETQFYYGVQSGNGGFLIEGGATVNGNVYSNGNIIGHSGVTINGSAIAASSPPAEVAEANNLPVSPPQTIAFGTANGVQDLAQSFRLDEAGTIYQTRFYMRKTGTPSNITVKIAFDNNGAPGAVVGGAQVTLPASSVGTSFGWVGTTFGGDALLQAGVTYWLVLDKANNTGGYEVGANFGYYADGVAKLGRVGSSWNDTSPAGLDGYFEIYTGGLVSRIEGEGGSQWWQPLIVNDDSWAHSVIQTRTNGVLYCQISINNYPPPAGTPCDTSRPDPPPQDLPISDSNIQTWKDEVAAVTASSGSWQQSGSLTVPWNGITQSVPLRVNGNLSLNCTAGYPASFRDLEVTGNVTLGSSCPTTVDGVFKIGGTLSMGGSSVLTAAGTVWVVGNVSLSTTRFELHPSYGPNSGIFLTDGRVTVGGDFHFEGSGEEGSYPLLITTNACPYVANCSGNPAVSLDGSAGAVAVAAPYGVLRMAGGSGVKAMVAHRIEISGAGTVTYESGLANLYFSSGPSGGFSIDGWREI